MSRPRLDGTPARPVNKIKLTDTFVASRRPVDRNTLVWDSHQPGLALAVRTTGRRTWKVVYRFHGRSVWLALGDARSIGLADARRLTAKIMLAVAEDKDPAADRKAERMAGTFADLAAQYVELHARRRNKSWRQAARLVERYLLPRWGRLTARSITRADVRAMMIRIEAPILANQVLASASAVFSWAIRQEILVVNPCQKVDRNPTKARERVLSDTEVAALWPRLDPALRLILLTGQRPGEVAALDPAHITKEGWWELPGHPVGDWPGTKNKRTHRVALSDFARAVAGEPRPSARASSTLMRELVAGLGIERATPHDLRRTCLTWVTRLGFGRDAMDRVANHKTMLIRDVYDRWSYADEDRKIMAAIARHVLTIVEGAPAQNVVNLR